MSEKMDLKISGSSKLPGGEYKNVSISGTGVIQGDLRADSIRCSGCGKFTGSVQTSELKVSGSSKFESDVTAEDVAVVGSGAIEGNLNADRLVFSGSAKVGKNVHCKTFHTSGSISVGENVEAEQAEISGAVKIGGLLNAENIVIQGATKAKEIGCATIEVRPTKSNGFLGFLFKNTFHLKLDAEVIEADHADLIDTRADIVRGRDVRIGTGCNIRRVEYTDHCDVAEGTVAEVVKI